MKVSYITVEIAGFTFIALISQERVFRSTFLLNGKIERFLRKLQKEGYELIEAKHHKIKDLLHAYSKGERVGLERVEIEMNCGEVFRRIYSALRQVPFGQLTTYGQLARIASTSPRAVGRAMALNRIPLFIPCHRVIKSDGSLGGFTPSIEIKKALLRLEGIKI